MLRKRLTLCGGVIIVLAALVFVVLIVSESSWAELAAAKWVEEYMEVVEEARDDDEHEEGKRVVNMEVMLDDDAVDHVGIETQLTTRDSFFPEIKGSARVIDIRDLLELRSQYHQIKAALSIAKVSAKAAEKELERLRKLTQISGSVAAKNVNYAEVNWQEAKAKLQGLYYRLQDLKDLAAQSWGDTIVSWGLTTNSKQLDRLLTRQDSLLLVTLPMSYSLPDDVSFIRISRDDSREQARKAYFVAPALALAEQTQGETYYFKTATGKLRFGMRLDVWIPKSDSTLEGTFIPENAIVWFAGKPWVYIELTEGHYKRKPVGAFEVVSGGVFVQGGFEVGEALVITGGQMLLSEEFSWQIIE